MVGAASSAPRARSTDPSLPTVTTSTHADVARPPSSPPRSSESSDPFRRAETEVLAQPSPSAAPRAPVGLIVAVVVCTVVAVGLLALLVRAMP